MKYSIIISAAFHAAWVTGACFWTPALLVPVAVAIAASVLADSGVL